MRLEQVRHGLSVHCCYTASRAHCCSRLCSLLLLGKHAPGGLGSTVMCLQAERCPMPLSRPLTPSTRRLLCMPLDKVPSPAFLRSPTG